MECGPLRGRMKLFKSTWIQQPERASSPRPRLFREALLRRWSVLAVGSMVDPTLVLTKIPPADRINWAGREARGEYGKFP